MQDEKEQKQNIITEEDRQHCIYLLRLLLPFLKQLNDEQTLEKDMEAKRQGISCSCLLKPKDDYFFFSLQFTSFAFVLAGLEPEMLNIKMIQFDGDERVYW